MTAGDEAREFTLWKSPKSKMMLEDTSMAQLIMLNDCDHSEDSARERRCVKPEKRDAVKLVSMKCLDRPAGGQRV